ncbi:hypothetical protein D478_11577 [Brevibacillus agri BAB-2500]|nr:hypothetical protein D478_11577 [Brevibacillus agri BAB-2500]
MLLESGVRPASLLPYDYEKAAKLAEEAGRVDYAHAIRTGRARL